MGEWMIQVPVKLDPATVERLDLLRGAYPFKPGRSTVIRELVEEGLRLIAEGILQFRAQAVNRVQSVSSGQSVLGIPEFPSAVEASPTGRPKPLTRTQPPGKGVRQRAVNGVSRRSVLAESVGLVAYNLLSFQQLQRNKFNRDVRSAA